MPFPQVNLKGREHFDVCANGVPVGPRLGEKPGKIRNAVAKEESGRSFRCRRDSRGGVGSSDRRHAQNRVRARSSPLAIIMMVLHQRGQEDRLRRLFLDDPVVCSTVGISARALCLSYAIRLWWPQRCEASRKAESTDSAALALELNNITRSPVAPAITLRTIVIMTRNQVAELFIENAGKGAAIQVEGIG